MTRRLFDPEQDAQLATEYMAGSTLPELAEKYGGSNPAIRAAVLRGGGRMRPAQVRNHWSDDFADEAIELYKQGWSVKRLASKYRTRTGTISELLARRDVELHLGGKIHPKLRTERARQEIVQRYKDGESLRQLAIALGCTMPTIRQLLEREHVEVRGPGASRVWTDEVLAWAAKEYRSGRSQQSIADELGVQQTSVSLNLRKVGAISYRQPSGQDSHGWKGGRVTMPGGYVGVLATEADREFYTIGVSAYLYEHRLVMGRALGRPVRRGETVHHINGDKTDNRLENLQLRSGNHGVGVARQCLDCGSHNVAEVPLADAS